MHGYLSSQPTLMPLITTPHAWFSSCSNYRALILYSLLLLSYFLWRGGEKKYKKNAFLLIFVWKEHWSDITM